MTAATTAPCRRAWPRPRPAMDRHDQECGTTGSTCCGHDRWLRSRQGPPVDRSCVEWCHLHRIPGARPATSTRSVPLVRSKPARLSPTRRDFPCLRSIRICCRTASTLRHHGVDEFATSTACLRRNVCSNDDAVQVLAGRRRVYPQVALRYTGIHRSVLASQTCGG